MTNKSSKEKQTTSAEETLRQRSFIELAQALTAQKSNASGRPLTYCLTTFGCQMNEKQSEAVAGRGGCGSLQYLYCPRECKPQSIRKTWPSAQSERP